MKCATVTIIVGLTAIFVAVVVINIINTVRFINQMMLKQFPPVSELVKTLSCILLVHLRLRLCRTLSTYHWL